MKTILEKDKIPWINNLKIDWELGIIWNKINQNFLIKWTWLINSNNHKYDLSFSPSVVEISCKYPAISFSWDTMSIVWTSHLWTISWLKRNGWDQYVTVATRSIQLIDALKITLWTVIFWPKCIEIVFDNPAYFDIDYTIIIK